MIAFYDSFIKFSQVFPMNIQGPFDDKKMIDLKNTNFGSSILIDCSLWNLGIKELKLPIWAG